MVETSSGGPGLLAFVFPGQGTQRVGMARELYDGLPACRALLEAAQEAAGFDLLRLMFDGPEDDLTATENQQPAILATSAAHLIALRERGVPEPAMVAGHSLGEYTALVAAGVLGVPEAVRLVRRRGELMAAAGQGEHAGCMAVVLGLAVQALEELCARAREDGGVWVSNLNAPGQTVISGTVAGVESACRAAREAGAKRVTRLPVSGAFHCELMAPAAEEFWPDLAVTPFSDARVPVVQNWDAQPHTSAEELREGLRRHFVRGVLWQTSVERMVELGARRFVEIGPAFPLSGMIRRISGEAEVWTCQDWLNSEEA